jgi:hypothetical protein
MKTEKIKKFRIVDKEYLPENVVAIEVEEREDTIYLTYRYDRDGFKTADFVSMPKLKLYSAIYERIKSD